MNTAIFKLGTSLALAGLVFAAPLHAERAPLGVAELRECAQKIQFLRTESNRIFQQHEVNERRRIANNQKSEALRAERASLSADELREGLDFHDRNERHQSDLRAFNAEIENFKREIVTANNEKLAYERDCNGRSYPRSAFEQLTPSEQAAMQRGLADVSVPYLDPAAKPPH